MSDMVWLICIPTVPGRGKCPFLGIGFTSPKQISVGDEISPSQLGDVKHWDINPNPCYPSCKM